jgi:hypothetical protein
MPAKPLSLEAYADQRRAPLGRVCWVCSIPERAEADKKYGTLTPSGKEITAIVVREWLLELGYQREVATMARLHYHFGKQRHHLG